MTYVYHHLLTSGRQKRQQKMRELAGDETIANPLKVELYYATGDSRSRRSDMYTVDDYASRIGPIEVSESLMNQVSALFSDPDAYLALAPSCFPECKHRIVFVGQEPVTLELDLQCCVLYAFVDGEYVGSGSFDLIEEPIVGVIRRAIVQYQVEARKRASSD